MAESRERRDKASAMTGEEWKCLRDDLGLSVKELADALHCSVRTIYNIENENKQRIGYHLAFALKMLAYPATAALIPQAEAYVEQLLGKKMHKDENSS